MALFRLITLLAAFGVGANAFSSTSSSMSSVGIRSAPERRRNLFRSRTISERRSPAFMVSASVDANDSPNDAVLRQIDSKINAFNKKKERAMKKLDEAEASLQQLESKKQEYIAGSQLAETPVGGNFSETAVRSAVKAMMWRVIAGSVTFVTSLRFSGSIATALSIVGSDFFSKAFTMFIGERLMNKSSAGRKAGGDNAARSLAKALIWRLFAICNTLTMAFFVAKDLSIASKIAGSDAIFKTALMFFYERAWANIQWGKEYQIEFSI
mmetsp:Transcript_2566/g.3602  ORF Transcript_2566/g.3602 Transcript_2566/m.3602 type:complete len:268 (+) Transcript_2566:317-1120(+)